MLLFLPLAFAASPGSFDDLGTVLRPDPRGAFAKGMGAPTVEWDGTQFVMFFESPAPDAQVPEGCGGAYQIGRATSPDGETWTVDEAPALSFAGEPGTTRYCSVSQPAVSFDGRAWNLFWNSSREPADGSTTNQPTGIGWATSGDGVSWRVQAETLVPYQDKPMGLPSAATVNDRQYLLWSEFPNLFVISRPAEGGAWTPPELAVDHQAVGAWSSLWVLGPSLVCSEDPARPLGLLFAGDDEGSGARSLAWAESTDGVAWTVDPASPLSGGSLDYGSLNHWELAGFAEGGAMLFYSRTDETSGTKAIGVATTGTLGGDPLPRLCPNPYAPTDTGEPDDTGSTDTGPADSGEDSGKGAVEGGCGCRSTDEGAIPALAMLGLLVSRRRRPA